MPTTQRKDPLPVFCFHVELGIGANDKPAAAFFKSVSGIRYETEIVPGVPAFAAAASAVAAPLVRQTDVLTVLPGTLPEAELARRLADTDGAIIMKLGRTFPTVRRALATAALEVVDE